MKIGTVVLVIVGIAAIIIVIAHRRLEAIANRAQMRAYDGVMVSRTPVPGMVAVVFHTYYGFFVFTHQVEHRFWALPDDAKLVLSRLNRFNLTWGFFAYGAVLIPFLSLANYWVQRLRINRQAKKERRRHL